MSYNEKLAEQIRQSLSGMRNVVEKKMFGGIAFLINEKMCIGVDKDDMILRCDPEMANVQLSRKSVRPFDLTSKPTKGWFLIGPGGTKTKKAIDYWIEVAVEANGKATTQRARKARKKSQKAMNR